MASKFPLKRFRVFIRPGLGKVGLEMVGWSPGLNSLIARVWNRGTPNSGFRPGIHSKLSVLKKLSFIGPLFG